MFGQYKTANTRQHKRLLADYLIKYRIAGAEGEEFLLSNIKDISASGLRFWTEEPLLEGALLLVEVLPPPINRVVRALARVVRVRRAEKGEVYYNAVQFVEISGEDQNALNYFIERIAAERGARALVPDYSVVSRRGVSRFF